MESALFSTKIGSPNVADSARVVLKRIEVVPLPTISNKMNAIPCVILIVILFLFIFDKFFQTVKWDIKITISHQIIIHLLLEVLMH